MSVKRAWLERSGFWESLRILGKVGFAAFTCFAVFATSVATVAAQEEPPSVLEEPEPDQQEPQDEPPEFVGEFPETAEDLPDVYEEDLSPEDIAELERLFEEGIQDPLSLIHI